MKGYKNKIEYQERYKNTAGKRLLSENDNKIS